MTSARGGVSQMLIYADQGGEGVWKGPFYADVILERSLTVQVNI